MNVFVVWCAVKTTGQSQGSEDKRRTSENTKKKIYWGAWIFVCIVCCVGKGLCDELITRPGDSCARARARVIVCDQMQQ
jgi:hypothetical protein